MSAQAGDCWVADAPASPVHARAGVLAAAGETMRGDPAINAMPGVRYRLHRLGSAPQHRGAPPAATAYVLLHRPDAWEGRCGLKP